MKDNYFKIHHFYTEVNNYINNFEFKKAQTLLSELEDIENYFLNTYNERKKEGVYFTSDNISQFIINISLITFLNHKINLEIESFDHIFSFEPTIQKKIGDILLETSLCDPTCGSGVFLYNSVIIILELLKNIFPNMSEIELKTKIINNIYGLDINSLSIDLCKLKLYKWILNNNFCNNQDPFFKINRNLQVANSLINSDWSESIYKKKKFNLIIGNPPYGNILSDKEKKKLKNDIIFSNDIYCAYILKALNWSNGIIGFLVPKSFLLRQNYIDFRNTLFSKANILKIYDIGPNLFKKATNEVQVFIYNNKEHNNMDLEVFNFPDKKITTYHNQDFDSLRICKNQKCQMNTKSKKYFAYTFKNECSFCNSHTINLNRIRVKCTKKILNIINKIEGTGDFNYLNINKFPKFIRGEEAKGLKEVKKFIKPNNKGTCYFLDAKKDFSYYYFSKSKTFNLEDTNSKILKGNNYEYYKNPKLLIKHNNIYPEAIFTKDNACFTSSIYSLLHSDSYELKYLCAVLNSIILQFYCIFGINNQKDTTINLNQYMIRHLPILKCQKITKQDISEKVDFIIKNLEENKGLITKVIKNTIIELNSQIFDLFSINANEINFIIEKVKESNNYFYNLYH